MVDDLTASFKTVHDGHVEVKEDEVQFLVVGLDILEHLETVNSLLLDVDVKASKVVGHSHKLEMVVIGYQALNLGRLKKQN